MSEILQTKLDAHISESNRRHDELANRINDAEKSLKNKVSYKEFTWTLGIEIMILMAMFGWIAYEIGQINLNYSNIDKNVSMIQGKLDPYNVQFKN